MPQFPARSLCKLRVVRPLRAAPATCAWCDKEEPQHPTFTHTLAVVDACLVYQRLLMNSYYTSDLCRLHGLARPPSASCDWRTFGHSTMSDQADAWFPRPTRTPPALSRHKDQRAYCASRTHTDATIPGAELMQATRGATSARSSFNLRMVRQRRTAAPFSPPDDDAWLDIHQRACTRS